MGSLWRTMWHSQFSVDVPLNIAILLVGSLLWVYPLGMLTSMHKTIRWRIKRMELSRRAVTALSVWAWNAHQDLLTEQQACESTNLCLYSHRHLHKDTQQFSLHHVPPLGWETGDKEIYFIPFEFRTYICVSQKKLKSYEPCSKILPYEPSPHLLPQFLQSLSHPFPPSPYPRAKIRLRSFPSRS